jgi:hypothetical protein
MDELKIFGEIEGFDRVLYESTACWSNFTLGVINNGKAPFEAWTNGIDSVEKRAIALNAIIGQIERFILSVEWSFGHLLRYTINNVIGPTFGSEDSLLAIKEKLTIGDHVENTMAPRKVPKVLPQVPVEARRWIHIWLECTKLSDYVEEQLRRQYLIIEELWPELHPTFNSTQKSDKKDIKLIRDFVSHASCGNSDVVSLVERDLPSAVELINGQKHVQFKRTTEHRNYVARFEVKSREIARELVNSKMRQFGIVSRV